MSEVLSLKNMSKEALSDYLGKVWKNQLKLESVHADDDFLNLGGQSVDMFRMLTRIESDFDCEIDFDAFFEDTRLSVLLDLLLKLKTAG